MHSYIELRILYWLITATGALLSGNLFKCTTEIEYLWISMGWSTYIDDKIISVFHSPTYTTTRSVRNYPLLPRNGYIWKKKKRLRINPLKERWAFWSPSVSNSGLTERNKSQLDASCLLGHLILYVYVVFELVVSKYLSGVPVN